MLFLFNNFFSILNLTFIVISLYKCYTKNVLRYLINRSGEIWLEKKFYFKNTYTNYEEGVTFYETIYKKYINSNYY